MFVISIAALKRNTRILREVKEAAGCHLVLALKGFSCWKAFPFFRDDLDGCCTSGLWEAWLARDYFQKHIVTYSPAYDEADVAELCGFTDHLDFNSLSQWFRFREMVMAHPRFKSGELLCGLRINPQCSTGETPLYDPCVAGSRLGITAEQLAQATPRKGKGCPECNKTGCRGRFGIFEIFVVNDEVRRLIFDKVPSNVLRKKALEIGMRTLREDGPRKVLAGLTTVEEVVRATVSEH